MPDKRCLVKSCKTSECGKRIFPIPSIEVIDENVFKVWFSNVDKDRSNHDRPYGICSRHFAGEKKNSMKNIFHEIFSIEKILLWFVQQSWSTTYIQTINTSGAIASNDVIRKAWKANFFILQNFILIKTSLNKLSK